MDERNKKKVNICKVIGCNNSIMEIKNSARNDTMKDSYGYCQIHNIEGLIEEVK